MPIPVQSRFAPEVFSGVVVAVDVVEAAVVVEMRGASVPVMLSVTVKTLKLPNIVCDPELIDESDIVDTDELVDDEPEDDVAVREVVISFVTPKDAEATKSQSLATNTKL